MPSLKPSSGSSLDAFRETVPKLRMVLRPPGGIAIGIGYQIGSIPGIPDTDNSLAAGLRNAADTRVFDGVPKEETRASILSIAQTYTRASYHKLRFDEGIHTLDSRRASVGGPCVADLLAVQPVVNEAMAFLGAARTVVDLIVYIAARCAGETEKTASRWEASEAIQPKSKSDGTPSTKYNVPEIVAIRSQGTWFDELNTFRNVIFHGGGWTAETLAAFLSTDVAEETTDPAFNVMLLPDIKPLKARKPPHRWTYGDGNRLDTLINSVYSKLGNILETILVDIWNCALPESGTVPKEEQPDAFLVLPTPAVLKTSDGITIPVFESCSAAEEFTLFGSSKQKLILREVQPTRVAPDEVSFLLSTRIHGSVDSCQVALYGFVEQCLAPISTLNVGLPKTGPMSGIVQFQAPSISRLYVWQPSKKSS